MDFKERGFIVMIKAIEKVTAKLKYKLGWAKEGRDFFTCYDYDFCRRCKKVGYGVIRPCELKFVFAEDWFIYAIDSQKNLYSVNTEMWEEWFELTEKQMSEKNALKKYILPIARKRWQELNWSMVKIDGKPVKFSYFRHLWVKVNLSYHLYYRWKNKLLKLSNKVTS